MSIDRVREYFRQYGIEDRVMELDESSATVELAALALGTAPQRIAKTMSFYVHDAPILIVMAGDARVDNKKYKGHFGAKAKMIPLDDIENAIGHKAGGVCPFAVRDGVAVYLDESLRRFASVFPAAGSANSAIELTISELERYSNYVQWIDVTKVVE